MCLCSKKFLSLSRVGKPVMVVNDLKTRVAGSNPAASMM
jgi:hypothetical protein